MALLAAAPAELGFESVRVLAREHPPLVGTVGREELVAGCGLGAQPVPELLRLHAHTLRQLDDGHHEGNVRRG